MINSVRQKIVGTELFISASNIVTGVLIGTTAAIMRLPPTTDSLTVIIPETVSFAAEWWWVGLLVAVVTAVLVAGADRSRAGRWAMIAVFAIGSAVLIWTTVTGPLSIGIWSVVLIGMAIGMATNRVLFGVVRPVPEVRKRREQTYWYDWF